MAAHIPTLAELGGNAPTELKERAITVCKTWLWTPNEIFCHAINRTAKLKGVWMDAVERVGGPGSSSVVDDASSGTRRLKILSEIVVLENMCDAQGLLHSGCVSLLLDTLTSMVFLTLKAHQLSVSMNVNMYTAVPIGTTLHIVCTSVIAGETASMARAEFYDKSTNRLLASGEHNVMSPFQSSKHDGPTDFSIPLARLGSSDASSLSRVRSYENQIESVSNTSASPSNTPVLGNGPQDLKLFALDILSSSRVYGGSFCQDLRGRIQLREVNVLEEGSPGSKPLLSSISEVEVTPDMTNGLGHMHGGCGNYLIQCMTSIIRASATNLSPLVTSNLTVNFHAPALTGSRIQIITQDLALGKRTSTSRCEIRNANTGKLLISGTHTQLLPAMSNL